MGCCEVKTEFSPIHEPELNIIHKEDSFDEINISSEEYRAATNPNQNLAYWVASTPQITSRARSTSHNYSKRIELAFLMNSPLFTKTSDATKSVLIPFSENSLELGMIKEEEKDVTLSFENIS
jgi:hypothetical protein